MKHSRLGSVRACLAATVAAALPLLAACEGPSSPPTAPVTQATPPPVASTPEPVEVYGCGPLRFDGPTCQPASGLLTRAWRAAIASLRGLRMPVRSPFGPAIA